MINRLDWDSDFFGYEIGKYTVISEKELSIDEFENSSYKLIYVFSDKLLDKKGLVLADTKVVFHKCIEQDYDMFPKKNTCIPFDLIQHGKEKLESMAIESGKFSRFKLDKKFKNNEFERLYIEWINKSFQKKMALEVLVYMLNDELAGFITITKKNELLSDIGLVAVDPKFQGKGIGGVLIKAAENYSVINGFKEIQVVTQEENVNAVKFYSKNNFELLDRTYIYHYWR